MSHISQLQTLKTLQIRLQIEYLILNYNILVIHFVLKINEKSSPTGGF